MHKFWDQWNLDRVRQGLVRERLGLCEVTLNEFHALHLPAGSRILEVACGAGWLADRLCQSYDYLGLDFSGQAIAAARARVPSAIFEVADFHVWDVPVHSFDVVFCVDAIAYFQDQDEATRKMATTLRPLGWLVMTTVNPFCYSRMRKVGPPGEGQIRKWLTRRSLHQLLERNGFRILVSHTALPAGDMGILRWVNSRKLNDGAARLFGAEAIARVKELLGLGQFRIVVAQLRPDRR